MRLAALGNHCFFAGEFYFSDVYCDRRLPDDVRAHETLFGECIGGALYEQVRMQPALERGSTSRIVR